MKTCISCANLTLVQITPGTNKRPYCTKIRQVIFGPDGRSDSCLHFEDKNIPFSDPNGVLPLEDDSCGPAMDDMAVELL